VERVVVFAGPGRVELAERPARSPGDGEVLIETLYSGISAGTELTAYRGTNPYLHRRWDPARRLFTDAAPGVAYPLEGGGYEQVGRVSSLGAGAGGVALGDVVWGSWGHRSHHLEAAGQVVKRVLPPGAEPLLGVFARIGAIALNAVLDADLHVGERVAVFGLGVPGLIAAQLARLNGGEVIAVDGIDLRLELARRLGAWQTVDFREERPAERIRELTANRGVDVAIELSGAYTALGEAIRATAYGSRVVAAGFYQGDAAGLRLGEEFHHNRVEVVCSQISGVRADFSHRWDRDRLERTVLELGVAGRVELRGLVSHVFDAERAAEAFTLLDESPEEAVQVVLKFAEER
jgi:2-desacetyl-2-hydroxyethyl bacteriochlorophyllide A dehydrogenase